MRKKSNTPQTTKRKRRIIQVDFPSFRNEAEEAVWWDTHPEVVTKAMEKAFGRPAPTQSVTIRLPAEDVAKARRIAAAKGLRYQTVVKTLLHKALVKEASAVLRAANVS
jgi:predicted DNA binding CopG/RHH family protein